MRGTNNTEQPDDPGDLEQNLAELYDLAITCFNQGSYGLTLQALSQISKLSPGYDDRENLRSRAAAALDGQQRDRVFNSARADVKAALQQNRLADVAEIVVAMDTRLTAENLALTNEQRLEVNRWSLDVVKRERPKRKPRRRRQLPPPVPAAQAQALQAQANPATPPVPAPRKRRASLPPGRVEQVAGLVIVCALVGLLLTVVFLGASGPTENSGTVEVEAEDDGGAGEPGAGDTGEAVANTEPAPTGEVTGIERLRAIWADERQSIVEDLNSVSRVSINQDNILTGPGGMVVDLSACPAGWDSTAGINDGVIRLAHTTAQSGNLSAYGQFGLGMTAYFDQVNKRGGIGPDGLQVQIDVYDDEYNATRTEQIVDDLLAGEQPFAVNTLGSPNTFAVRDALNDACVPQPMVMSSHPAWADPDNFPWTTGLSMSFAAEAWLWGSWIDQRYSSPVVVAALVMDNDLGLSYEKAFSDYAESSPIIERVEFVRHDPTASSLDGLMVTLAQLRPMVYISMTAGNPCLLAINAAADVGLTETADALITPSICKDIPAYLAPAGTAADQWLTFGGGVNSVADPAQDGIYPAYVRDSLTEAGLDWTSPAVAEGFGLRGWALHQVLEVAANLDGGLNRTNFLIAQWGLRAMTNPMMVNDIRFGTFGPLGPGFIEGSDVSRFDATDQVWRLEDTIDRKGAIPPCRWVDGVGCT